MSAEFLSGRENSFKRMDRILDAHAEIRRIIWNPVAADSRLAFDRLDAAIYAGAQFINPLFFFQEERMIKAALPAVSAKIQLALVDVTMFTMLDLIRRSPQESHVVELFPQIETENDQKKQSAMDILEVLPDKFKDSISPEEQARQHVASVVVIQEQPDQLTRLGLKTQQLFSPVLVGDKSIFTVPTCIDGIYLRYEMQDAPKPGVKFVIDSL